VGNNVKVLTWPDGSWAIPSVVYFASKTEVLVGRPARERLATDPAHAVASPKRLLGRKAADSELQPMISQAAYKISSAPDQGLQAELWGEKYTVAHLLSFLLKEVRGVAQRHLGNDVRRAVLAVPVSFDRDRIKMVKRAAAEAELDIVEVIDEPSAAALANRFLPDFGGIVGVYDFGGGTFDFSVVDVSGGDFRVLATAGDAWLGGNDLDQVLAESVATLYKEQHSIDLRTRPVAWQKLLYACERTKRELSNAETAMLEVDLPDASHSSVPYAVRISRDTAEQHWRPLIERSLDTCQEALSLVNLRAAELSAVFLSGGTTNVPAVRRAIEERFGVEVKTGVPPEHAVCFGAGIHAAQLARLGRTTLDAT
jgi:molecular chaperone DnaK (HSP70)